MLPATVSQLNFNFPLSCQSLVRSSGGSLVVRHSDSNSLYSNALLSIIVSGGLLRSLLLLVIILLVLLTGDASY